MLNAETAARSAGSTYVEVLIAATLLAMTLLSMGQMLIVGYSNVSSAGKTTMGLAAARQLMEDVRRLPFERIAGLDGFASDDPTTLPADDPEREVAQRWRYALAGAGVGWSFSDADVARWTDLAVQGDRLGAAGSVRVASSTPTLTEVSVTVSVPGRWRRIELTTRVARR